MRFAVAALRERGLAPERICVSMERSMKCAIGHCGHCQLGPAVRLQGRSGVPLRRASSRCWRCASSDERQAQARGLEVRLLRRLPAQRARPARTSCSPLAGELEIAYFLEAAAQTARGPYDLSLVEGSITTPEDAERIQRGARAVAAAGDHRRLRDRRRHPGAAQLRRRRRLHRRSSTRRPEYVSTLGDLDADLRPRRTWTSSCRAARSTSASCSR